ncbi:MAG TPA: phosphoribosyltransferase family protein [Gemmatimonadales bacterium]|nr:phosphoribosyltransferase family protein [Gemmatimonadales bacterium]
MLPPRAAVPSGRDVLEIDWAFFGELCRALAFRIAGAFDPELVLGIAKAGVIPGVVVASILQRDFASMGVTRPTAGVRPTLVTAPPPSVKGRRVLIVDETCDTGDTLKLALSAVRRVGPAEVRTAVSFKTGPYSPDFYALETGSKIILPWDREVLVRGEFVMRPEYAAWLSESGSGAPSSLKRSTPTRNPVPR